MAPTVFSPVWRYMGNKVLDRLLVVSDLFRLAHILFSRKVEKKVSFTVVIFHRLSSRLSGGFEPVLAFAAKLRASFASDLFEFGSRILLPLES